MNTRTSTFRTSSRHSAAGFTLVEMIVVTLLLLIAMVGLLAVFDASARINKNETDVADAQGGVRYGIYQMTRVVRMAGSGGLFATQAVLNTADSSSTMGGIAPAGASYDNVAGVTVTDTQGNVIPVRNGTDVLEVRGVIFSPLVAFDQQSGCSNDCTSSGGPETITVKPIIADPLVGQHVNDDAANRPQFASIIAYTATASANSPMLVVVSAKDRDLHPACAAASPSPGAGGIGTQRFPQVLYNVGLLTTPAVLQGGSPQNLVFPNVDFGNVVAMEFNTELPSDGGTTPVPITNRRRIGVLDDVIFFIGLDPALGQADPHPYLGQGIRRGNAFEVTRLADDVEDLQVAYGIDQDTPPNYSVSRNTAGGCAITLDDPDLNESNQTDCDEWIPNAPNEVPILPSDFFEAGAAEAHCPRLHGVMISLLAKAHDPDPTYKGPASQGYKIMNSTATPVPGPARRRVQTLRISLRNYEFQG